MEGLREVLSDDHDVRHVHTLDDGHERLRAVVGVVGVVGVPQQGGLVAPVARALNDMSGQIHRVVEWQELMLQTVAHELRTPLARVRFVASRVADAVDEGERAEALADLDDDLSELEDVVSSVLTLVRADHGVALGLGLAMVKGLVEAHGQTVTLLQSDAGGLRVETRWSVASPPDAAQAWRVLVVVPGGRDETALRGPFWVSGAAP